MVCIENVYPLPLMKDMPAHLGKGKIFTKLDIAGGFFGSRRVMNGKLHLTVLGDNFQVLPFGLQGSSALFMELINEVLHDYLYKEDLVCLIDVLLNTEIMEEHVKLVQVVLKRL